MQTLFVCLICILYQTEEDKKIKEKSVLCSNDELVKNPDELPNPDARRFKDSCGQCPYEETQHRYMGPDWCKGDCKWDESRKKTFCGSERDLQMFNLIRILNVLQVYFCL